MQERYCHCGRPIIVEYVPASSDWNTVFLGQAPRAENRIFICPSCGAHLDIDKLR